MVGKSVPSLIIGAPSSGSGKTTITLALLRALRHSGLSVGSFKVGPDYIDPVFHRQASQHTCFNIDPWAMSSETISGLLSQLYDNKDIVIGEGVMGLFDGAQDGSGSTADVAALYTIPVILVVDAKGQAASVAALLSGFDTYRDDISIAGVIFNKVGGPGHVRLLREAAEKVGIPLLGCIPKSDTLTLNQRHLGLVQAREMKELDRFLDSASEIIAKHIDLEKLCELAAPPNNTLGKTFHAISPLGQHIAIAEDDAFSFIYPHILEGWKNDGTEISFFSPLEDLGPSTSADAIFLPGGYPELYCEKLSSSKTFKSSMAAAAAKGVSIYGECGGFMVLGEGLIDKAGQYHQMLELLPIKTSFENPKLHLGYRRARLLQNSILGEKDVRFKAHEFHYAQITKTTSHSELFEIKNARGEGLGNVGAVSDNVAGSFIHLIDRMHS
jgi:cobyrinic acid a,c-diamide synthase